jgi:SAM-dependent methyltransferase
MLSPNTTVAEVSQQQAAARARFLRELEQGLPIDIHFHTFTPESIDEVLRAAGFIGGNSPRFKLLAHAERYPPGRDDGIGLLLSRTNSDSDPAPVPETFALASTTKGVAALPLVCPVSLSPLRLERKTTPTLVATRTGLRYPFVAGLPALLPPRSHSPMRSWGHRSWRNTRATAESASAGTVLDEPIRSHLDEPGPSSNVDPLCFFIRGWLWLGAAQDSVIAVEAWVGETLIGETGALYVRADVATAHWLEPDTRTGFELFAHHAAAIAGQPIEIEIRARLANGQCVARIFTTRVSAIERDYRRNHFGVLLDQRTTAVQRRANVFAEGPSSTDPSGETALLLRRYLPKPPCRVIDVGCGIGSYGRGLLADGYDWLGVEVDAADCTEMSRLQLPHRQADGHSLPFADGHFDAALCLDVLEHLEDPASFVREMSRVAPRQLIVTVPNCELLGYLWDHLAAPWHMLEGDHKNFFTRWSLGALLRPFYSRVELRFQGPYPLRTIEGTPLYYHLFAVAQR